MAKDKCNQIVCFDVETGGFDARKNPITQIALLAFRTDTFEEIARYSSYIKPYDSSLVYEPKALEFTNISMDKLRKEGKDVKVVMEEVLDLLDKANTARSHTRKPILLGHNVMFDIPFLQNTMAFAKVDYSKKVDGKLDGKGNFQPYYLDTMWLARIRWPENESHKLELACEMADVSLVDGHDAMNDVIATKELYESCITSMRSSGTAMVGSEEVFRTRKQFQF